MRILQVRFDGWMSALVALLVLLFASHPMNASANSNSRGQAVFGLCLQCHGADGEGNALFGAPRIAGLPQWYIQAELEKFRSGARGMHYRDDAGNRMRPMMRTITVDDMAVVAAYVSSLKAPSQFQGSTLSGGNVDHGKALYATCAACHGPEGDGNEQLHAPPIKLLNDWYIVRQLSNFKNKIRAGDPAKDPIGATMAPNAAGLDDQGMKDVAAYIQTLRK